METISSFEKTESDFPQTLSSTPKPPEISLLTVLCRECRKKIVLSFENKKQFGTPCSCAQPSKYIHKKCLETYVNSHRSSLSKKPKSTNYLYSCNHCGDTISLNLEKKNYFCLDKAAILKNIQKDLIVFILFLVLGILLVLTEILIALSFLNKQLLPESIQKVFFLMALLIPICLLLVLYKMATEYFMIASFSVIDFQDKRHENTIEQI